MPSLHDVHTSRSSQIQPVTLNYSTINGSPLDPPAAPHIQPAYYGGLVIDTFVGSTGSSQIVELSVSDNNTSGYAVFEGGQLVRAVFVNLHAWVANSTGTRPIVHIDLNFAMPTNGTAGSSVGASPATQATARRLVIQQADDTANLTWAGQSYEETTDVSPTGQVVVENINLQEGLDLRATEAVLITF